MRSAPADPASARTPVSDSTMLRDTIVRRRRSPIGCLGSASGDATYKIAFDDRAAIPYLLRPRRGRTSHWPAPSSTSRAIPASVRALGRLLSVVIGARSRTQRPRGQRRRRRERDLEVRILPPPIFLRRGGEKVNA